MPETLERNYQSISDMDQEVATESWKKFYICLSGITNGAHVPWVRKFKGIGQIEVDSEEDSDYILLFCPIASRVGTDVGEALENISGNRRVILVVMHHTFNPDYVLAESRRLVNNPNVRLVVDCLFHEGRLLDCNCNDMAWFDIQKFLGVTSRPALVTNRDSIINGLCGECTRKKIICIVLVLFVVFLIILLASILPRTPQKNQTSEGYH